SRPGLYRCMGTQNSADQGCVNRRRSALAAHVSNHDGRARHGIIDEIVEIATNRSSRHKLSRYVQILKFRECRWQKTELQLARHGQVAFEALFLKRNLLVKLRIFNRDRNLSRERGYGSFMVVG